MLPKSGPKQGFLPFFQVWFISFICNDSLKQCLTSRRGKTLVKNFGTMIWTKGAKIGPKTKFSGHFLKFGSLVSFKLHRMIAWNKV